MNNSTRYSILRSPYNIECRRAENTRLDITNIENIAKKEDSVLYKCSQFCRYHKLLCTRQLVDLLTSFQLHWLRRLKRLEGMERK